MAVEELHMLVKVFLLNAFLVSKLGRMCNFYNYISHKTHTYTERTLKLCTHECMDYIFPLILC